MQLPWHTHNEQPNTEHATAVLAVLDDGTFRLLDGVYMRQGGEWVSEIMGWVPLPPVFWWLDEEDLLGSLSLTLSSDVVS